MVPFFTLTIVEPRSMNQKIQQRLLFCCSLSLILSVGCNNPSDFKVGDSYPQKTKTTVKKVASNLAPKTADPLAKTKTTKSNPKQEGNQFAPLPTNGFTPKKSTKQSGTESPLSSSTKPMTSFDTMSTDTTLVPATTKQTSTPKYGTSPTQEADNPPKFSPQELTTPNVPNAQSANRNSTAPLRPASSPTTTRSGPMGEYADVPYCGVEFIDDIRLPAKELGVIKSIDVKEGDFVSAGQKVGQIDDELYQGMFNQAKLRYDIAREAAADTNAIEAAQKKYQVATIEARKASKLAATGSKSDSERRMAEYTAEIAEIEWRKAENDRKKAAAEAQLAYEQVKEVAVRIKRHIIDVKFNGYIVELIKKEQEHVSAGEDIMRVARMDRLWVTGNVDVGVLNAHEIVNRPVTVTVKLARGEKQYFEGRITHVALERQTRDSYSVKAEISNKPIGGHWVLQPNMLVDMRIHLDQDSNSSTNNTNAKSNKVR
jgi:multidrug resistance efflux pump